MEAKYNQDGVTIYLGDCLEVLAEMPADSVDSIVTDPPYGIGFMGKGWDHSVPPVDVWRECLRVLKPGGHLLAFAGTRTQHRMCCNIEDAGFEIRDMIAWVYGSGFPKSHNISKAIDKAAGAKREVVGIAGSSGRTRTHMDGLKGGEYDATDDAKQWNGWGTALKPALEPITLARKPFKGTVAANVIEHGTGGLNVDACRVGEEKRLNGSASSNDIYGQFQGRETQGRETQGRWPANLIHDGSDEVVAQFPQSKGAVSNSSKGMNGNTYSGATLARETTPGRGDSGSAARFFYCPKASKKDRGEGNNHPTVKPTDLMRYLCRLVTPPGGVVLDPFSGSGSTCRAARLEGFEAIGIELNAEYIEIAFERLSEPRSLFNGHTTK